MFEPHALLGNTMYSPAPYSLFTDFWFPIETLISLIKHFSLIVKWKPQYKTCYPRKKHQETFGGERARKFISMSCVQLETCGMLEERKII